MENDTFITWLFKVFVPVIKKAGGQHILYLDGHAIYVTLKSVKIC